MTHQRFSLLAILLFTYSFSFAQTFSTEPTAISAYRINVEDDMYLAMDLDPNTIVALLFQQDKPEAKKLMQNTLDLIYEKINKETAIQLAPIEALKGHTNYSKMGYPIGTLKKAGKSGVALQYVSIDITVTGAQRSTTTTTIGGPVNYVEEKAKVKPEFKIVMKFADATGKKTEKVKGKYRHDEKIEINSESLAYKGWSFILDNDAEAIPYYYFLEKAIDDLIAQLPKK